MALKAGVSWYFTAGLVGSAIRPVLSDLVMSRSQGEWDTHCAGEWGETVRTLALAEQPAAGGYHDILLRERRTMARREERGGECESTEQSDGQRRYRLSYDGQNYRVPQELQRLR